MIDGFEDFEQEALAYDPFAGDFGGSDDKFFSDKFVRAAKQHDDCHICGGSIQVGERHRHRVEKFDGEMMSFRWCWGCCVAMARVWSASEFPADREICDRQDLHRRAA